MKRTYKLKRNRPTIGVYPGWQTYPGTIHSFLDFVFRGIQAAASELNCNLLIACGSGTPFREESGVILPVDLPGVEFIPIGTWNTDGLIAVGPILNDAAQSFFDDLYHQNFPYVFAGNQNHGPAVTVDNEGGIHQAIRHLRDHGHQRIAFISGRNLKSDDSESRLLGYISGMQEFGLPYDPDLIEHGWHTTPGGYDAITRIITRGKPFTAAIVSNDESAVGVVEGLRHAGLNVPDDVAVIGFDDRLEARANIPLLTSVHHPMFEMGYQSVELLLKIIEGEADLDSLITIPTHLVVRESCGCTPGVSFTAPIEYGTPQPQASFLPGPNGDHAHPLAAANDLRAEPGTTLSAQRQQIAQAMADQVYREMQCSSHADVALQCHRLLHAFEQSLVTGNVVLFRSTLHQVLEHVVVARDDIYTWQKAVTILSEWAPLFLQAQPAALSIEQAVDLLSQARIAITEMLRGQYSSKMVQETATANLITQLSSRYFAADTETEIYTLFREFLPQFNIEKAIVAYYQPLPDDQVAMSKFKMVYPGPFDSQEMVSTREFPDQHNFPAEDAFQLAVFPLYNPEGVFGYMAFQTALLDPLGFIVRQLMSALHNVNLYQQAVEARRLAEEANDLKSRFLSVVSHELRTPLNLIFGLSNMMLEESRPANALESIVNRKDLERVYIGAQHLESLIRDVLDLARSDVGQLTLVYETLDLHEVVEAVAEIGEPLARDKDLSWQVRIPDTLPLVHGDRTRLRQVLLNLVNNAVKFTIHGSIHLTVSAGRQWVTVAVCDTGLGIPLNEQSAIFDEFQQSTRTSSRGFAGLGLGLSICKRLVEMHGGQIGVQSTGVEGTGSTFYFKLPVLSTVEPDALKPAENPGSERVLLLVKDLVGGEQLKQHLQNQGFQVDLCADTGRCTSINRLVTTLPGRIIIDLDLTSERGWEILKSLKENPQTRDIPVLFFALNSQENRGSMINFNIMSKPLNTTELAQVLQPHDLEHGNGNGSDTQYPAILVVDDDPEILDLHSRIIESLAINYRVLQAKNGREALEIIRAERPKLVLLDLMMPEVDGFEVLETMQAEDLSRFTPVIVLTSQVLTQEDMERLNVGVASVLRKGLFTSQQTLDHITTALANVRRPGSETQRIVMKAMGFIHQHYAESILRSHIAEHVGLSERHLTRCFHQEVGLTPMSYLNRYRVQQAVKLLEEGKSCITDIALDVGFSNGGYFTKVFREEMGISPREYLLNRGKNC